MAGAELDRLRQFVDDLVAHGRVPGAGLAVAFEGQPVFEHYAGKAREDLAAGPEVLWPLASISKLYTAAAIMRLIEQGRISLISRVEDALPGFARGDRASITLRQLLTHTSGIPYESPQHTERLAARWTVDQLIDEINELEPLFVPGTNQLYSDLGFALSGRMAAAVSGLPFQDVVSREVLAPSGLKDTFFPTPERARARTATVLGTIGFGTDTAIYNSAYGLGLPHPAFGVVATLPDLLRFALLFDPASDFHIHSRAGLLGLTTDQTGGDLGGDVVMPPVGIIHSWGAGFMIRGRSGWTELTSPESYGHFGATGCGLWIDPVHKVTIAHVSNQHYGAAPDDFMPRLNQVLNVVMATMTA